MPRLVTAFLLLVLSIFLALAMVEVLLRVSGVFGIEYGWQPKLEGRLEEGSDYSSDNSSDLRILLLGDSQVTNPGAEPEMLPAKILEHIINRELQENNHCDMTAISSGDRPVSVSTLGAGGWGQDQQFLSLAKHIGSLKPDLVLLWFTPENDLWNNTFPTHYPRNGTPKPTFIVNDGEIELVDRTEILPSWMELRIVALGVSVLRKVSRRLSKDVIAQFPRLDSLFYDPDGKWDRKFLPPMSGDVPTSKPLNVKQTTLESFNPYFANDPVGIGKSHFVIGMNPGSPRIDSMVELTSKLVKAINHLAMENDSMFAAFYYTAEKTTQPLYPPDGTYKYREYDFVFSSSEMKARLSKILGEYLLFDFELEIDDWRKPNNDPHLTTKANQAVMSRVASELFRGGLICRITSN